MEREWNRLLIFQGVLLKRWYQQWPGWFWHSCQQDCNSLMTDISLWLCMKTVLLCGWLVPSGHLGANKPQNEGQVPAHLGCSWKDLTAGGAARSVKAATLQVSVDMFKWLEVSLDCVPGILGKSANFQAGSAVLACEADGAEGDAGEGRPVHLCGSLGFGHWIC